jgi:hypothetical protein
MDRDFELFSTPEFESSLKFGPLQFGSRVASEDPNFGQFKSDVEHTKQSTAQLRSELEQHRQSLTQYQQQIDQLKKAVQERDVQIKQMLDIFNLKTTTNLRLLKAFIEKYITVGDEKSCIILGDLALHFGNFCLSNNIVVEQTDVTRLMRDFGYEWEKSNGKCIYRKLTWKKPQ